MDDLLNTAPCGFLSFDDDGRILLSNSTLREMLGYTSDTLRGRQVDAVLSVAGRIFYQTHFFPLLKLHDKVEEIYLSLQSSSGEEIPVLVNGVRREREGRPVNDCIFVLMRRRNQYEDELLRAKKAAEQASRARDEASAALEQAHAELKTRQAELLEMNIRLQRAMAETHHRVKNNLQLISALIEMQHTDGYESVPMSEWVRLGANVRALGVIHDLLTQRAKEGEEQATLSAHRVLQKLLALLEQTTVGCRFCVTLEDAHLAGRQATALALITNELVLNAQKHGKGNIDIRFTVASATARLEVCDDGPGFPEGFDPVANANTGLELIESTAKWDLGGTTSYENRAEGGARIVVHFPLLNPSGEQV
jgi:PAS domain S-box-containing protein